jgi:RNA polymerase sigma-70 factor, ECF subfamily
MMDVELLYSDFRQPVQLYLTRLVKDWAVAEDLCQDTFAKALRAWNQRRSNGDSKAWLYRIATNTAYDYLNRQRIATRVLLDQGLQTSKGYDIETWVDDWVLIQSVLAELPDVYRVPLLMFAWAGYTTQEIAAALGCSNNCIKMRLYRARQRCQQMCRQ